MSNFKIEKIGGLGKFGKIGAIKFARNPGNLAAIGEIKALRLGDSQQAEIARTLGNRPSDYRLAGRVMKLKRRFPTASLPELVAMDWLKSRGQQFVYQAQLFGGRRLRGGVLPDFVLQNLGGAMVWAIQGEYWHTKEGKREKDRAQKLQTLGQIFGGQKITEYVEIWESDIYDKRPMVFEFGLAGIGLRG